MGINRLGEAEGQMNDLRDKVAKTPNQNSKRKKNAPKSGQYKGPQLQDNIKHTNIRITGVPEEESKKLKTYLKK